MEYVKPQYYGVSSGDGNNGVSSSYPDYLVLTNDPWCLAKCAAISSFKRGKGWQWARDNMETEGEEDYGITVSFSESPETQKERENADDDDYGSDGGAWLIYEIHLWQGDPPDNISVFDSGEEAFDEDLWKEFNTVPKYPSYEVSDLVTDYDRSLEEVLSTDVLLLNRIGE